MDYLDAILLGIVQGVAEFLPISSSGHLVIIGAILKEWRGQQLDAEGDLQMNVALHFGTLLSILVVYRRDLLRVLKSTRLCAFIVLATIPVATVGLLFKDTIEGHLAHPLAAGICLFITAGLLAWSERSRGGETTLESMTVKHAGIIGLFQSIAILPGISRSGSTISGGLLTGLKPDEAARFSFLIAIPAIAGAVVVKAKDYLEEQSPTSTQPLVLLAGAFTAFLVGWLSLQWLIGLINRRKLHWFAWYCGFAGAATIVWQLAKRLSE